MRNPNLIACNHCIHLPQQQRGVVLLLTLIVLVAMMLAAIGMMRSIDTTTQIAGNVAFRQTTLQAGDGGLSTAIGLLMGKVNTNKLELNNDYTSASPALAFPGYMAHPLFDCEVDGSCVNSSATGWWDSSVTFPVDNWSNAPSFLVKDGSGQTIATVSYWVQRMCTAAFIGYSPNDTPPASPALCQTYEEPGSTLGSSMGSGGTPFKNRSVFYRITAKSVGPRNTVTYSQSLVLVPE